MNNKQAQFYPTPTPYDNKNNFCDLSDGEIFEPQTSNDNSSVYSVETSQSNNSSQYQQNMVQSDAEDDDSKDIIMGEIYDETNTMLKNGFSVIQKLRNTLQGCVYHAKDTANNGEVVIKITNKELMTKSLAVNHKTGKRSFVHEDIRKEINVMFNLNNSKIGDVHRSMIKMHTVFEDDINIFVVMENGGQDMLDFINECHIDIRDGKISLYDWQITTKLMHKQIIEFVDWLHRRGAAHLDISLENMAINNVEWIENKDGTKTLKSTFCIKFIDFGLSEFFNLKDCFGRTSFQCNKFVGKSRYQSPKIYKKLWHDARQSDVWSVGVCLFMISLGTAPWIKPDNKDHAYYYIVLKRRLCDVLKKWNRSHYVCYQFVNLFYRIFVDESGRINTDYMLKHEWLQ